MSEDRGAPAGSGAAPPPAATAAERLYPHLNNGERGELGETGFDVARKLIDSGIARPDTRFADERPPPRPDRAEPATQGSHAPFDAARYTPPGGGSVDTEAMQAFSALARDNRLSQAQGDAYLALHDQVMDKRKADLDNQWNGWWQASQREFGRDLEPMADAIKTAIGSDPDAQEFYRVMTWSGLSFNPSVLKVLYRLSNGGRRW
jgi:hypothetical protein